MNEELQVGLGLKINQFQEGLKSASRSVDSFGARLAAPMNTLRNFGTALSGLFAIGTLQSLSNHAEEIRNLAEGLNVGTTELQRFRNALEYSGVSTETSTKILGKFTQKLNAAASGSGDAAAAFANAGVEILDQGGKIKPTMEILADLSDLFATMEDKSERSRIAVELFGKQGLKMVGPLSQGREELERLGSIKKIISPEALENLDQVGDDLKEIFDSFKHSGVESISVLSGGINAAKRGFLELKGTIEEAAELAAVSWLVISGKGGGLNALSGIGKLLEQQKKAENSTPQQSISAREKQIAAVAKLVKASKEQAEFEKETSKIAMERATATGKVFLLTEKERDLKEKIAAIGDSALTNEAKGRELVALQTQLAAARFDLEKATNEEAEADRKKRIAAYNEAVDSQDRLNKALETEAELRKALLNLMGKSTKLSLEDIANLDTRKAKTQEEAKAIEAAQKVMGFKREREELIKAQKEGRAPLDPGAIQKLLDKELELRLKLPEKFFREEEIKPLGDIPEKLQAAQDEAKRVKHEQAAERELQEDDRKKDVRRSIFGTDEPTKEQIDAFNESVFGPARDKRVMDEWLERDARQREIDAGLKRRQEQRRLEESANLGATGPSGVEGEPTPPMNGGMQDWNQQPIQIEVPVLNVDDLRASIEQVNEFDSLAIEAKLDRLNETLLSGLKVKPVNGP